MTHRREPATVEAVLTRVLLALSDSELTHFTGKTRDFLRKCANPMDRHKLAFADALALDLALLSRGQAPAFLGFFQRRLRAGESLSQGAESAPEAAASVYRHIAQLQASAGDLARAALVVGDSLVQGQNRSLRAARLDARIKAEQCAEQVQLIVEAIDRVEKGKKR